MTSTNIPVEPEINEDGYYLYCPNCSYFDIVPHEKRCPKCTQIFSWEWLKELENK